MALPCISLAVANSGDAIRALGIDTAKGVLNAPREMLINKADLEEDTVDEVLAILRAEFENED